MKTILRLLIGTVLLIFLGCTSRPTNFVALEKARNQVAILSDTQVGTDKTIVDAVADALRRDGFEITFLSAEEVCDSTTLAVEKYFLYLIPDASSYPSMGADALSSYLKSKGNLMILGKPTLDVPSQNGAKNDDMPVIETVSPSYKTYPLEDITSLKISALQHILPKDMKLPAFSSAFSCYARPEGKGFERGYKWRWIPLVKAFDKDGEERGTPVWILLNNEPLNEGPDFNDAVKRLSDRGAHRRLGSQKIHNAVYEGAICAVCAIDDPAAIIELAKMSLLGDIAGRIRDGLFLSHAGSEYFSYWPEENVQLGAVAVNHSLQKAKLRIRTSVSPKGSNDVVFQKESGLVVKPGQPGNVSFNWLPASSSDKSYIVTTELLREDKSIDIITHELGILSTEKSADNTFVTVKDGDFWFKGEKWYPIGINYWPRYYIGLDLEDLIYYWLSPGFYNPEEVERDLAQMESMGINFLEIRADVKDDRRNLLDFLRRCEIHDIKVSLFGSIDKITDEPHYFQGVMMPTHYQEELVDEFIRDTRLADNPTLLGYDIMWEPAGWLFSNNVRMFGFKKPKYRQRWDKDWAKWIDQRYGSLANAEADWGVPAPLLDGAVTSPDDNQFREDGPWRIMIAAYRRFMDDLISRKFNDATRKLRQIDPNHLISFRQGGTTGLLDWTNTATPKHIDFSSPEGYSYRPDEKGPDRLGFTNRYIHFASDGKPFLWAEFGYNVWDRELMEPDEQGITLQGKIHEMIYNISLKSGANGAASWWWPGGYRACERADFGITNPDGTLRPSGLFLKEYTKLFKKPRTYPKSDIWVTLDRDTHSRGLNYYANNEGRKAFKKASAKGLQLGIRTPGTGTTSIDAPLLAVGNTKYNGKNPPKYLNAEFNWFKIKVGDGEWIDIAKEKEVQVIKNKSVTAMVSVGNLQEAKWLTPENSKGKPGAVYLATTEKSDIQVKKAIDKDIPWQQNTDFGGSFILTQCVSKATTIEFQMTSEGRAWFGEKLMFKLVPVDK